MGFFFYALLAAVAVSGALIGRWWALLIPFVVWPSFYLGVGQGWWGSGLGEAWWVALPIVVVVSLAPVAFGVGLRSRAWARFERRTR
jgi:hypothetical protein